MRHPFRAIVLGAISASALGAASAARADMLAQFFTVQADGRDFGPVICCFANHDEVLNTLGPNGLPVWNSTPSDIPNSPTLLDRNLTTNELNWWTVSSGSTNSPVVTSDGPAVVISGNSYDNGSMYPVNGTNTHNGDGTGFQTAIFSGSFNLNTAQTIDFSLGADDDALLFVDGKAAVILGGIHGDTPADNDVALDSGAHTFELFYADRQETGAALNFSIPNDVAVIATPPTPGVPEPAAWALMILGFGAVGASLRTRRQAEVASA
ncbi:PEPxxWA-CTERM sorting domain-containing protein [Phenylobacterium sp.]|jgi:fibro-slime domain-containing protein|uniref:PEPxxWA-CTERM sorting domain-containing protein n=1 Tax=Phenylobacterium sp. TaxID=1871053 RepID=UPI002F3F72A7